MLGPRRRGASDKAGCPMKTWRVQAGPSAFRRLREQGWQWDLFDVLLGASGGPKWLVLSALDQWLCQELAQRDRPLHLLGSSSGAYRFAAYVQDQPGQAVTALRDAYVAADWRAQRSLPELRGSALSIVDAYLKGPAPEHPTYRLHISTSWCKGLAASDRPWLQLPALLLAALCVIFNRRWLSPVVSRVLFSDPRDALPSRLADLTTHQLPLQDLRAAVLASGAIPLVLPGEPHSLGVLRDGGLVDYHFDKLELEGDGLILYPHFSNRLEPGWLERFGRPAPVSQRILDRMVLISPHPDWVATLPDGRIPCRTDSARFGESVRQRRWQECCQRSQELADTFRPGPLMDQLVPF
jgi:hypothetical protein